MSLFAQLFTNQLDQKRVYNIVADGAESGSRARISHDVSYLTKIQYETIRKLSSSWFIFYRHCHRQKNNKKHSSAKGIAKIASSLEKAKIQDASLKTLGTDQVRSMMG